MSAAGSRTEYAFACPNCRGGHSIIAIWYFIDPTRVTQEVGGSTAENLLMRRTEAYTMATPPSPRSEANHATAMSGSRSTDASWQQVPESLQPEVGTTHHLLVGSPYFHIHTRLADGRPSIIIDPGSVGNLCGDQWAKEVARAAALNGCNPSYTPRPRPLKVSGVGNGSQECHYDCTLPIALREAGTDTANKGNLTIPAVHKSELPGLLGLQSLRQNRAVLDFNTLKLYFCGPGDYDMDRALPTGSDTYQLELAPSGHLVLPCSEFQKASTSSEHTLTLMSRSNGGNNTSSGSGSRTTEAVGFPLIPPPPTSPPVLPQNLRHSEPLAPPPQ